MPPSLIQRAIPALPGVQFINAFGQTETGATIAMVPPEDHILEGPPEIVEKRRKHLSRASVSPCRTWKCAWWTRTARAFPQ